jgi:hypothetical protein
MTVITFLKAEKDPNSEAAKQHEGREGNGGYRHVTKFLNFVL